MNIDWSPVVPLRSIPMTRTATSSYNHPSHIPLKKLPYFLPKSVWTNQTTLLLNKKCTGKKIMTAEAAFGWRLMRDASRSLPDTTFIPLDARKTSAWIAMSGIKNDKVDAQVLAYACLHDGVQRLAVYQPSPEDSERYTLFLHRDQLVRRRVAIKNKIKAFSHDHGTNPYTSEPVEPSDTLKRITADFAEELAGLTEKITGLEKEMIQIGRKDQAYLLMLSIPGIGPITAFALRYKMGVIDRFASAKHLASYFGFGIRQKQSGGSLRMGGITHCGDQHIRSLLVQCAQTIRFRKPELVPLFFPDLAKKHTNKNKVVVALARKLLTFAYYCWKRGEMFDLHPYQDMRNKQQAKFCLENTDSVTIQRAADPGSVSCPA